MKHAGKEALERAKSFLGEIRKMPGLKEKKPGIFYKGSRAFLHLHEDRDDLFADVRLADKWERTKINSVKESRELIRLLAKKFPNES